jgi:hypothetical protein
VTAGGAAATMICWENALTPVTSDNAVSDFIPCLQGTACTSLSDAGNE